MADMSFKDFFSNMFDELGSIFGDNKSAAEGVHPLSSGARRESEFEPYQEGGGGMGEADPMANTPSISFAEFMGNGGSKADQDSNIFDTDPQSMKRPWKSMMPIPVERGVEDFSAMPNVKGAKEAGPLWRTGTDYKKSQPHTGDVDDPVWMALREYKRSPTKANREIYIRTMAERDARLGK